MFGPSMGLTLAALGASLRLSKIAPGDFVLAPSMALALRAIGFAGVRDGILPSQSNPLRGIAPARRIKIRKPPKGGFVFFGGGGGNRTRVRRR